MNDRTKKFLSWLMLVIVVGFVFVAMPYDKIKDVTNTLINNIDDFINNIDGAVTVNNNSSSDHHIKNTTFYKEDDIYYVEFSFYSINPSNVLGITINNKIFEEDTLSYLDDILIVDISSLITDDEITPINVSVIYTKDNKQHISTLVTSYHKGVNYQTIEEKRLSLVGIKGQKNAFFNTSSNWGSGVILSKKTVTKSGFFNEFTMYEYIIVTNYHVIEGSSVFYIYNDSESDEYPKRTPISHPNETVELIGTYTKNTDLAFLSLITFDDSLAPLDDKQFITKEAVSFDKNDTVFLIGSPVINDKTMFNSYKIGQITEVAKSITLIDSDELCKFGCEGIGNTAYLGKGSSGGGLFDISGNLIGINFAGDVDNAIEAFAIPIYIVLEAYEIVNEYEKRSLATSFFLILLLHNQLQLLLR